MGTLQPVNAIPPGQYAPLLRATEGDHRDRIVISSALGVSFVLLALILRTISRKFSQVTWGMDDTVMFISFGLHFVQSSLLMVASANGLGATAKSASIARQDIFQMAFYASQMLYIAALDASKIVGVLFIHRITSRNSSVRRYSEVVTAALSVSSGAFVLAAGLQCNLSKPWEFINQKCPDWFLRWEVHAAFACVTEVGVFVAPLWLVWDLQKPIAVKAEVVAPFALRLLIMCLTGMRLRSFDRSGFVTDASLAEAEYFAWTQWELTYSVLASTFPSTQRSFLDLVTFYNNGYHTENETSRSRTLPAGESFKMTVLSSKATASDPRSNDERIRVRDDEEDHDDASSQEMIITKKFTYEVLVEDAIPPTNPPLERHFNFEDNRKIRLPVPDEDLQPEYTGRKRVQQTL